MDAHPTLCDVVFPAGSSGWRVMEFERWMYKTSVNGRYLRSQPGFDWSLVWVVDEWEKRNARDDVSLTERALSGHRAVFPVAGVLLFALAVGSPWP